MVSVEFEFGADAMDVAGLVYSMRIWELTWGFS